jgi:hypothetical protein
MITLFLLGNDLPERFQEPVEFSEHRVLALRRFFYFIAETLHFGRQLFASLRFHKEIGDHKGKILIHGLLLGFYRSVRCRLRGISF